MCCVENEVEKHCQLLGVYLKVTQLRPIFACSCLFECEPVSQGTSRGMSAPLRELARVFVQALKPRLRAEQIFPFIVNERPVKRFPLVGVVVLFEPNFS